MNIKKNILWMLILFLLTIPGPVLAQIPPASQIIQNNNPVTSLTGAGLLGQLISRILFYVFAVAGLVAFVWAFIGVFQYIVAGGNKEGLAKARARITWAFIGLIFLIIAYSLAQFVPDLFSINTSLTPPAITPIP